MHLLIGTLMRRRTHTKLHGLSLHILRDIGLTSEPATRNPLMGDKA
ncbi:hypothetical protein [Neotabrizicola shimadae]|uniref:DUF1127 domain-containing protein n=1 Tax=Neotabrizicola shimadae TaxID=2807096 RepID=A0A8G0ZQ84_9RHOB|nr:hypothetical protein [Neotabrizicola shimadae]QYZ68419.1 hypothetical protein JO391_11540 [Neotabrizicola shimadae]